MDRLAPADPEGWSAAPAGGGPFGRPSAARPLSTGALDIEALLMLGLTLAGRGQTARAAAILDRVARECPDEAHPCRDLTGLLPRLSRAQVAEQYRACIRLAPEDVRLRHAFANFLQRGGELDEAIRLLRDGLQRSPDFPASHAALGVALGESGETDEAMRRLDEAIALSPGFAAAWAGRGLLLRAARQFDAALAAYDNAVACAPNDAEIRVARAMLLLHAGRWAEGWPEFEWRLRLPRRPVRPLGPRLPALAAATGLRGRTLLLLHEEGIGDTIMCLRYVPQLAALGLRVVLRAPPVLHRLARSVAGLADVCSDADIPPDHDLHCAVLSLPLAFATGVRTAGAAPYLAPEPAAAAAWAERLPRDGLRVGLAWAAQSARLGLPGLRTVDRRRSLGLSAFPALAQLPGVRLVSLQHGPAATQANLPPAGLALCDPMTDVVDLADTAAIIANLDAVVSVDSAVAHLAGAMGKPVFLLDRHDNCWRWLAGRADTPWYSTATILRQERAGDWTAPVARLTAALDAVAAYHGAAVPHPPSSFPG